MNKKYNNEIYIENTTNIQEELAFKHVGQIRRFLGYDTVVVFYRFYFDSSRHAREEYCISFYKNSSKEDIDNRLKKLNKYKKIRFWEVSELVKLDKNGFNKIINEATSRELKLMKQHLISQLGNDNYMKVVSHINRNFNCPAVSKDH
ncbi:hypothetical protein [Enterococcus plantarum]|uniref:hypothetical protein n=1 Tax=Enterococcus plantarum TaxID=1077675 RepID=UPI001A9036F1|nr:hypothetical protein [Enterococcus plantarum]MBO0421376.1 hypothetical protein [Enterococcus plantarum]